MKAALSKLRPPQTLLDNIFLEACSTSTIQLMSGLTSLTYCEIVSPKDTIDLTPLKELATLQKLYLTDGSFVTAHLPAHLTNLTTAGADVAVSNTTLGGNSCGNAASA